MSTAANSSVADLPNAIDRIVATVAGIVLGKQHQIRLALACLLARGHLLIEDIPGVGKTTLAHSLAITLGLSYQRVQFTSDLLPSDVLGVSIYQRESEQFQFHPGPIFSQLLLADEINRTTPKTQSALLEAMEERQVTVDGETHRLPSPFFVIATQNPTHQLGTYALPESQLDRFLMRIELGYPDKDAERQLLLGGDRRGQLDDLSSCINAEELVRLQAQADAIHVSDALLDYLQELLALSRQDGRYRDGLSPRCGIALKQTAKAWALIHGAEYVRPEHVQAVFPAVTAHRLKSPDNPGANPTDLALELMRAVAVP